GNRRLLWLRHARDAGRDRELVLRIQLCGAERRHAGVRYAARASPSASAGSPPWNSLAEDRDNRSQGSSLTPTVHAGLSSPTRRKPVVDCGYHAGPGFGLLAPGARAVHAHPTRVL